MGFRNSDRELGPAYHIQEVAVSPSHNMFSVDLELFEQGTWERLDLKGRCPHPGAACVEAARYLLALLREADAQATFFVLGSVAEQYPDLIREIDSDGHEIATHGYTHTPLYFLREQSFRREIERSVGLLSDITGKAVIGYRAAQFSVDARTKWALDVLVENGFKYDSSIFPFFGPRYGMPRFPRGPSIITWDNGHHILEVPLSTVSVLGKNLPVAGGGYFRLLPYPLISQVVRRVNREGFPFVVYVHPYEFRTDPLSFQLFSPPLNRGVAHVKQWKMNMFRHTTRKKISRIMRDFKFRSIGEVMRNALESDWGDGLL